MPQPVVMGNWKLNGSKSEVTALIKGLNQAMPQFSGVDVVVAPPVIYMDLAQSLIAEGNDLLQLGSQNTDLNNKGAFTGDISPAMLQEFGVTYVIIGHSERRDYHAESDEFVAKKFAFLKENHLIPVLCIGETAEQNEAGETEKVCARQLDAVIKTQGVGALLGSIIAYEPIWAIGTGKAATAEDAQRIHASIRNHIAQYSADIAKDIVIQYGGSVKAANAKELFQQPDINGALVGGASLDAEEFIAIAKAAMA